MDLHRHSPVFLARLSNTKLLARVKHLARGERQATAVLIAHLAELDERRLYLAEGYSSLFTYCTLVLHLSEHAAYHRIEAARAARRFPVLLERLTDGSMTLTTIKLLSPHLTSENYRVLLARAQHQSRRVVEELVAELRPQPPVPAEVRRLPVPKRRRTPTGIVVAQTGFMPQTDPPKGVEGEDVHLSAPRSPRPVSAGQKQTTILHSARSTIGSSSRRVERRT